MIGRSLTHFEVTHKLGEGGMGEVYRATDSKLGREVAIKVLPEEFVADEERLARFEREAKVLASLSHSNIAGIFEVGEDGGAHFLVMELAEGETLAERLDRGPIPLDEALAIALQLAQALEAAHERGVVHRDLKPANVKVTADGRVKVLDFGLAKALEPEPTAESSELLAQSPTLTAQMTGAGIILGTAAYMSPEQARGREADRRSDLWALGVVLWELLTGERLFAGETVTDTLVHVLGREPEWKALSGSVPPSAVRLLRRTLVKEPQARLNHAGDARLELEEALRELRRPGRETSAARPRSGRRAAPWLAGLAGAALGVGAWIAFTPEKPPPPPTVLPLALGSEPVAMRLGSSAVLSPDGRRIVWLQAEHKGAESLWIRDLDGGEARALPGTEEAHSPFFSPDGREIAFFARGALRKVALDGSSSTALARVGDPRGGTWTDNGFIVFNRDVRDGLWIVPASGGQSERLTEPDREKNERSHRWPDAATGSRLLVFLSQELGQEYENASIEALDLRSGQRTLLHSGGSYPRLTASGQLLFVRDRALWAAPIELDPPRLTGEAKRVLDQVTYARWSGGAQFDVSETGALLYSVGETLDTSIVVQRAADGTPQRRILGEPGYYGGLRLSPEGSRLALFIYTGTRTDVWLVDLDQGTPNRFTFGGRDLAPVWSPDGQELAFEAMTDRSVPNLFAKRADGAGRLRALTESNNQQKPTSWSPDGILLYDEIRPATGHDIFALDMTREGSRPEPFAATSARERDGQFSPDGRWIAYISDELGGDEVFVQPYPGPGGRWQVSRGEAAYPRWSRDGSKLFYWSGRNLTEREVRIAGTDSAPGSRRLELGESRTVLEFGEAELRELDFDVAPDGSLFLLERAEGSGRPHETVLVLDWGTSLQARLEQDR